MKKILPILLLAAAGYSSEYATAQEKTTWASDVPVSPTAGRIYKDAKISVAYDGTIYVGRLWAAASATPSFQAWEIMKSTDTGATWTAFASNIIAGTQKYTALDLCAVGKTSADFKLFVARPSVDTSNSLAVMNYSYYNAAGTSTLETLPLSNSSSSVRGYMSVCFASDYRDPNNGSGYSIALAAVKGGSNDSVVTWIRRSTSASYSRRGLYGTAGFLRTISASIGSAIASTSAFGRLGVAWDEFTTASIPNGIIKVMYSYGDDGTTVTNGGPHTISANVSYRNPTICLSQVTTGTGSNDIRTMLAYEVDNGSNDINIFSRVSDSIILAAPNFNQGNPVISDAAGVQMHPHIVFDPAIDNFLITYHDSTAGTLPYLVKGRNGTAGAVPTSVFANYRDASANATSLRPRVDINNTMNQAAFVWTDNGMTMFDAEYKVVATSVAEVGASVTGFTLFPNPVQDGLNIAFSASAADDCRYAVLDAAGRSVLQGAHVVNTGANKLSINVSGLAAGTYVLRMQGEKIRAMQSFSVQ